jgi:hypothetical protein
MGLFDDWFGEGDRERSTDETPTDDDAPAEADERPTSDDAAPPVGPEWFARKAEEATAEWSDLPLDFSADSVAALDDHAGSDDNPVAVLAADPETDEEMLDRIREGYAISFGSYFGEVLVRAYDGEWTLVDDQWVVAVPVGENDRAAVVVFDIAMASITGPPAFGTVLEQIEAKRAGDDDATPITHPGVGGSDDPTARFEADAADVAEEWPRYRLDFSPNSLVRLDTLVAEEFRRFDLDDAALGGEDGASAFLTAHAVETGGYLGEVFVRNCGAEWHTEEEPLLVVPGPEVDAQLDPVGIAADCLRGEDSFTATYEAVRSQLGLDADPIDDDAAMAAITRPTEAFVVDAPDRDALSDAAASLAEEWPEYDLDRSAASLARLDDLVAATDSETLDVSRVGAYLGAVFREQYGAEWDEHDELGWVLALPDEADDDPAMIVLPPVLRDCLDGGDTFAAFHDTALEQTATDGPTVSSA